jgi:hypothetical protein
LQKTKRRCPLFIDGLSAVMIEKQKKERKNAQPSAELFGALLGHLGVP